MKEFLVKREQYTIYKCKDTNSRGYYLCIPNKRFDEYKMYIGFATKDYKVADDSEIISEISNVSDFVFSINDNGVYVLPDVSFEDLEQASSENDDRLYNRIVNDTIQPIIREVYLFLNDKVNERIALIKQNDSDSKLAGWMAIKYGGRFIEEVSVTDLLSEKLRNSGDDTFIKWDGPLIPDGEGENASLVDAKSKTRRNGNIPSVLYDGPRGQIKPNSLGFNSFPFIIVTLILSLVVGVCVGWFLMK